PEAPLRIECYDISHIMGTEIVGSMVVMEDGLAKRSDYRRFKVRTLEGQDDFAAMGEVLTRRFTNYLRERDEGVHAGKRFSYPPPRGGGKPTPPPPPAPPPARGPPRRTRLLKEFGSLKRIRALSEEELVALPWLPAPVAANVYAHLHGPGDRRPRSGVSSLKE